MSGKKTVRAMWFAVAFVVISAGTARAGKRNADLGPDGQAGGRGMPMVPGGLSKQPRPVPNKTVRAPMPMLLGMDIARAGKSALRTVTGFFVTKFAKEYFLTKAKRLCRLDLASRIRRLELATPDMNAKPKRLGLWVEGRFRSARVIECFKKLLAHQHPQVTRIGGRKALMFTSRSGKARVVVVTGRHTFVLTDSLSLSWVLSGNVWRISPSVMALRPFVPRRAAAWVAMGRIPFTGALKSPMLQGVSGIDAILLSVVPVRRARNHAKLRLSGRMRLANEAEAVKMLTLFGMLQTMMKGRVKSAPNHGVTASDAFKWLFVSMKVSRSGADLLVTAPLEASVTKALARAIGSKSWAHP